MVSSLRRCYTTQDVIRSTSEAQTMQKLTAVSMGSVLRIASSVLLLLLCQAKHSEVVTVTSFVRVLNSCPSEWQQQWRNPRRDLLHSWLTQSQALCTRTEADVYLLRPAQCPIQESRQGNLFTYLLAHPYIPV